MYYLWKEKTSDKNKNVYYITNYKEVRSDGLVRIDSQGYLDVELVFENENKNLLNDYVMNEIAKTVKLNS